MVNKLISAEQKIKHRKGLISFTKKKAIRFCLWTATVLLPGSEKVSGQAPQLILQKGHLKSIKSVSFSKNGKYILTAGEDHTAKIWDPFSGKLVAELNGSNDPLAAAYFSTNNKYVVTVTESRLKKRFSFWNPATGDLLYTIDQPQYVFETLAFSPNGELMAIAGYDKDEIAIRYTADRRYYKKIKGTIFIKNSRSIVFIIYYTYACFAFIVFKFGFCTCTFVFN